MDSSSSIDSNYIEINESLLKSRDECDHKDFEKKFREIMTRQDNHMWILDSGASLHFTYQMSDFIDFTEFKKEDRIPVGTATTVTWITGFGTVLLKVFDKELNRHITARLSPVHYIPNLTGCLLSLGMFLKDGMKCVRYTSNIALSTNTGPWLIFYSRCTGDTIYSVTSEATAEQILADNTNIWTTDYETMHRRLGHPSDEVLSKFPTNTNGTDKVNIPKTKAPCKGCSEGK